MHRVLPAAVALSLSWSPALADTQTPWEAELTSLEAQISQVEATIDRYDGGLILALAQSRREALLLMRTVLETRRLADEGGIATETVMPVVAPDPDRAQRLLGEIASAQARIEVAETEAARAGGLLQAMALSRLETEKLTLAQLQMGWLQAEYGIAFPRLEDPSPTPAQTPATAAPPALPDLDDAVVVWADPEHPDIDYSLMPFELAHRDGHRIAGWWVIQSERAAIDDSPKVTAMNHSAHRERSFGGLTTLIVRCHEGQAAAIFTQDEFLSSDFRRNTLEVTYRIDDAPAVRERWSALTSSTGAGLFGREAEPFIRALQDAGQLFIRVTDNRGRRADATFDLAGGMAAYEAVADACGFSLLSLTAEDYRAIQSLLNAGGFDAGTPDGIWGPASQRALRRFQADIGLPETGAPDRATLEALGAVD